MRAHHFLWRIVPLLGMAWVLPAQSQSPADSALPMAETRSNQAGHAPSLHGGQGLLEVGSAFLGRPGVLRLGLLGEHGWGSDVPVDGISHRRTAGTFSASYVPLRWLELSASWAAASHLSGGLGTSPVQALGDTTLAAKVTGALHPRLVGGVELMGHLFPGIGATRDMGSGVAVGFSPRLLLSANLDGLIEQLPLRAHLNVGGRFDNTAQLVRHALGPAEELALGIHRFPRLTSGLGVELPFRTVTPFAEHALALPMGVASDEDGGPRHTLAAGIRINAIRDLSLTLAGRLGLDRARAAGVPATLPFNVFLGAAFNLDALAGTASAARASAPEPPSPEPSASRLRGTVRDAETGAPLSGAVITILGSPLPPVATSSLDGAFLTHEVEGERVTLSITRDGYLPLQIDLPLADPGIAHELALAPRPVPTQLAVSVHAGGKPIPARLSVQGGAEKTVTLPASSLAEHVPLPAGTHTLLVEAEGHLAQTRVVQVSEGGTLEVAFDLAPVPAKPVVVFRQDRIEILQQVRFAAGRAELHPDSLVILKQVVDAVVRNRVPRLRVEGHTDSSGSATVNLRLSRERAQAVADALVSLGLDRSRLEVAGFGSQRPIAPNVNARGRELNRRVEFLVLESKE